MTLPEDPYEPLVQPLRPNLRCFFGHGTFAMEQYTQQASARAWRNLPQAKHFVWSTLPSLGICSLTRTRQWGQRNTARYWTLWRLTRDRKWSMGAGWQAPQSLPSDVCLTFALREA